MGGGGEAPDPARTEQQPKVEDVASACQKVSGAGGQGVE